MERVPQIRLFGTSQAWRPSTQLYQKKYTQTSSTGFQSFKNKAHNVQPTIQRSNSVTRFNSPKPTHNNYYKNAIRICEQNQILDKFKGHGLLYLKGAAYITQNHRHHNPRRPCTLCEAQAISKKINLAKQQKCLIGKQEAQNKNHYSFFKTQNYFEQSQPSHKESNVVPQLETHIQKTGSNMVTFQEISNRQENQIKSQQKMCVQQIRKIETERSRQDSPQIYNSNCDTIFRENNSRAFQKSNSPNAKTNNFAQIAQLISQLGRQDQGHPSNTSCMLKDLEEMTYQHLKKRRNCINQLDQILRKFETSPRSFELQSHIQLQPSLSLELLSNSQCLDSSSAQNSKRRNKIF